MEDRMQQIITVLKAWFLKEEGQLSISKLLATVAAICGAIIVLNNQLTAVGITIPAILVPYFKVATIISALVAMIRSRNSSITTPATTMQIKSSENDAKKEELQDVKE
jgi:hypothetical protein